jgi:hypothetical protein
MYKLTSSVEVNIRETITPKVLRELKSLGLYGADASKEVDVILDLFVEEDKFKKLTNLIFQIKDEPVWDEVSLNEWMRGYKDFFTQFVKSFSESAS